MALVVLGIVTTAAVPRAAADEAGRDRAATSASASAGDLHQVKAKARRDVGVEVVGGSMVPQGQYTFMTFIEIAVGDDFVIHCGGTLVDPLFVLTAAHCVEDDNGDLFPPSDYTLVIGRASLDDIPEANVRGVVDVDQHDDWNPETLANDVAVLELDEAVPAAIAQPLPFVGSGDTQFDSPGQAAGVAGWGLLSGGASQQPTNLRAASLSVISDAACEEAFGDFNTAVVICAAKAKKNSCQGDSGGPLFAAEVPSSRQSAKSGHKQHEVKSERKTHHKKHRKHRKKKHRNEDGGPIPIPIAQIGIVSFGASGCPPGVPSGYTQLSAPAIADFIQDHLN